MTLLWKTMLSVFVFTGVIILGVSALINNVIGHEGMAREAAAVALPLAAAQILVLLVLLLRARRKGKALTAVLLALVFPTAGIFGFALPYYMRSIYKAPIPALAEGQFAPMPKLGEVDFTVPADGSIEEVRDLIREVRGNGDDRHYTVLIEDGEYTITQIVFDERDHDTTWRSRDGGMVLSGGLRLDPKDFAPWDKNENIKVIDLTKLGLGPDDWGSMDPLGGNTSVTAQETREIMPCELYWNGRRCVTARYPNGKEWLKTGVIIDNGDSGPDNPRGGTFAMDKKTAARAAGWAFCEDIWVFGCFKYDWSDMSTPVKAFDNAAGTLTTEYASGYGYKEGGTYYFYNVLEELDAPGEWYLDRNAGLLYIWPPEGNFDDVRIDLSLSTETLITGENLENVSFIGLTLQCTRGDGIVLSGDNLTVDHCLVRNIAGSAISVTGHNNTVSDNEVSHVGNKGITIDGGDTETLTPGNSKAVNNLVHDWPEVNMNYKGGINIFGTGNLAAHNELYNSPHTAIFFGGNNHVIGYNLIHDVCLITHDAGAIYNGRSWHSAWGTAICNNVIYNLGGGEYEPCGIYLDDGLAGVTVENNLLVNVPGFALHFSGRDLEVHGNVVANAGRPVSYDQRTRDGALSDDPEYIWHHHWGAGGVGYTDLTDSPWQTDIWKKAYPELAAYSTDFADIEEPCFAANPAGSSVTGNTFVGPNKPRYAESVTRFSEIGPNKEYGLWQMRGYWTLPEYADIRAEQAGRRTD